MYLSDACIDKRVKILRVLVKEDKKRRFYDLGIIPEMIVKPLFRSPFGDPTAFLINGSVIALRREDTSLIEVAYE